MKGKDVCAMGKEAFQAIAPAFAGDILWEHLEILQKGNKKIFIIHLFIYLVFKKIQYSNHYYCEIIFNC